MFLGGYSSSIQRSLHKIRRYSLLDDDLASKLKLIDNDEEKRDFLVEHYSYIVRVHFSDLLYEVAQDNTLTNDYIEILSELVTNGVLHSKSNAYVLMFSDSYSTKFSISDNGIGLYQSMMFKEDSLYYHKFKLFNQLIESFALPVSDSIRNSLIIIFESLLYSMLKNRHGMFDLMCNVVVFNNGYFRLHNDNAQIVMSSRMMYELEELFTIRQSILNAHNKIEYHLTTESQFQKEMTHHSIEAYNCLMNLATSVFDKYTEDTRYSAIRFFSVKFRGVHIEVELPK